MLARSPLVMVLSQIRFPMEAISLKPSNSANIDIAMNAAGFPLTASGSSAPIDFGVAGTLQLPGHPDSRVYSTTDLRFSATVNPGFLSVYCVDKGKGIPYPGHRDFIEKICDAVCALEPVVGGVPVARIGYRYVDALEIEDALDVLKPPFRGFVAPSDVKGVGLPVVSTTVEGFFSCEDGDTVLGSQPPEEGIHVTCGTVPPGTIVDPAVPAKPESRWIVDIDAYSTGSFAFSEGAVREKACFLANSSRELFYGHIVTADFGARFD